MKDLVFITGNQHKADYLAKWLGYPIAHHNLDLEELQSLDGRAVVEHKVRRAYEVLKKPVLVEDATLTFTAMGHLPGTFIRWFMEDLGKDGLAALAQRLEHQEAVAIDLWALYDGKEMHIFEGKMTGTIAPAPRGSGGFGWDAIFINDGYDVTRGEMREDDYFKTSYRAKAIEKLAAYLQDHDAARV